ncbi:MAG: hypothetical protein RSB70_03875 [Clostridium sp.]
MLKRIVVILLSIIISIFMSGCGASESIKIKLGLKNSDFEYIKEGNAKKIIIQSTRDKGFKFVLTDLQAIKQMYDILASGKEVSEQSNLEPDYIFEIYEKGAVVHSYNYIAGIDKEDGANFYGDNKSYIVSSRLDNDVLKHFSNIRKPKYFEQIYYGSIIETIKKDLIKGKEENGEIGSVGVDISNDLGISKFILSTELLTFDSKLKSEFKNCELVQKGKEYDTLVNVITEGYKSDVYKAKIFISKENKVKEQIYYVSCKYESGSWDTKISTEKPTDF